MSSVASGMVSSQNLPEPCTQKFFIHFDRYYTLSLNGVLLDDRMCTFFTVCLYCIVY